MSDGGIGGELDGEEIEVVRIALSLQDFVIQQTDEYLLKAFIVFVREFASDCAGSRAIGMLRLHPPEKIREVNAAYKTVGDKLQDRYHEWGKVSEELERLMAHYDAEMARI